MLMEGGWVVRRWLREGRSAGENGRREGEGCWGVMRPNAVQVPTPWVNRHIVTFYFACWAAHVVQNAG